MYNYFIDFNECTVRRNLKPETYTFQVISLV